MGESFYTVLGVGTDADADAIERAYRDRVKECHPDVSDTPGARQRFKRLTVARDTLVAGDERFRYDTLGHERYVREHVTSGLFDVGSPSGEGTERRPTDESATDADAPENDDERTSDTERASSERQTDGENVSVGGFADAAAAAEHVATDGGPREWTASAAAASGSSGTAADSSGGSHGTPAGGSGIYGTRSSARTADRRWPAPLAALAEAVGTLGPWLVVYLLVAAAAGATGRVVIGTGGVASPFVAACLGAIVCIALAATVLHLLAKVA